MYARMSTALTDAWTFPAAKSKEGLASETHRAKRPTPSEEGAITRRGSYQML